MNPLTITSLVLINSIALILALVTPRIVAALKERQAKPMPIPVRVRRDEYDY